MSKWMALHGFMGTNEQWKFLESLGEVNAVDLYPHITKPKEEFLQELIATINGPINLIGYSMGARIAMELLLAAPDKFENVFLLAGHPGLDSEEQKDRRKAWEGDWIRMLEAGNTNEFIQEWNSQDIFHFDQDIEFCDRPVEELTACFSNWGLSGQKDLLPQLMQYKDKVHWFVGMNDFKYEYIADHKLKAHFPVHLVPNAGHRLLQHTDSILDTLKHLDID
jgi:2-succinyl-6-hydroxy-2,4-cyclohexadiene-1-carboxylate synthase